MRVLIWLEQNLRRLCTRARNAHVQQRDPFQASGVSWLRCMVALDGPE